MVGIASALVYPWQWQASVVLGFVAGLSQIIATMQLIECIEQSTPRQERVHLALD